MTSVMSELPQRVLIALVRGYRLALSPWLGSSCRFSPTCSAYALEALEQQGAAAGTYLTLRRLARCHPFCAGGHDPVPTEPPRPFSKPMGAARSKPPSAHPTSPEKTPS